MSRDLSRVLIYSSGSRCYEFYSFSDGSKLLHGFIEDFNSFSDSSKLLHEFTEDSIHLVLNYSMDLLRILYNYDI